MQIGGTLVTGVVRVLVVVATLAAAYYFIVRPVLDTTEKVSGGINSSIQQSLDEANEAFEQSNVSTRTQQNITTSIKNVPTNKLPRLTTCINRNPSSIQHIERCARRLSRN
ncbi:MAG: hypothetical protein U0R29_02790 [Solirubrobacterales bacterium]